MQRNNINTLAVLLLGIFIGMVTLYGLLIFNDLLVLLYLNILIIFISHIVIQILIIIVRYTTPQNLKVLKVSHSKTMRCLNITLLNPNLLEDKNLFRSIYQTIFTRDEFLNFGYNKIIILSCLLANDQVVQLHSNILINNDTSFETYYNEMRNKIDNYDNLMYGYHNETVISYTVKVWNMDNYKNVNIKQNHNIYSKLERVNYRTFSTSAILNRNWYTGLIKPISLHNNKGQLKIKHTTDFFTIDLETISINNVQILVAISSCGNVNNKIQSKIFLVDHNLLIINRELAIKNLWNKYFTYLESVLKTNNIDKLVIFAHNLGKFDGVEIFKGILNHYNPKHVNSIIDDTNTFISISHTNFPIIEFKDSLRIFPFSLNELCKLFLVEGKLMSYDSRFSNLNMFNNPKLLYLFKKYSMQDALSLFKALESAQIIYFRNYKVDITSIYSTATLSLKIYRSSFQDIPIFILPHHIDNFIRSGYYGGGTDVYIAYGENIHDYDINSLYPFAMLNPMPYNLINPKLIDLSNRTLDSFFGFAECIVNCPTSMLRPVLPYHHLGKTIYPVGTWKSTYFSEELKAVVKLGYKITLIRGYEFTKADLFSSYVNHFYKIKSTTTGTEKQLAKLQLNNLYGYFGRKLNTIMTENINNKDFNNIVGSRIVKSIVEINENYSTILSHTNINKNILEQLNNEFHTIDNFELLVKSNVALAAAVTAYARIEMIPFKINPNTLYTDTDSAFTLKPLDSNLIGTALGQMKDELKGNVIREAYFLGAKKYGGYIIDQNGIKNDFSVFSGVPRNSLSFDQVKTIFNGGIVTIQIYNRFFKSLTNLNIVIKDTHLTIKNENNKKLINNTYYPPIIYNGYNDIILYYYNKFRNLILKNFKKLIKGY